VHAARVRGELAARAILRRLGREPRGLPAARRRGRVLDRFAALSERLYPVPADLAASLPDETTVCRCEGVGAGEIRRAAGRGWSDVHGVKAATRAGMGPCQGRECAHLVTALTSSVGPASFTARMPLRPIPVRTAIALGDLVGGDE
jgi:D-hydroxyproline dehydrogenase subunit alpha